MWWWRGSRRLHNDIRRWQQAGHITAEGAEAILAELDRRRAPSAATALSTLGGALLVFAALSFVAAHWQGLPRLTKLTVLLATMTSAYVIAGELLARRLNGFAEAALLAGVGLFGANIMLVSQMYHIDGHPPQAVLLWAGGALATGVVAGSQPVLWLALALVDLWGVWETAVRLPNLDKHAGSAVFWPYLIGWAAAMLAAMALNWREGIHKCAVSLAIFVISLGYLTNIPAAHELVFLLGLAATALALWSGPRSTRLPLQPYLPTPPAGVPDLSPILPYALGVAGAGLYAAQMIRGFEAHGFGLFLLWAIVGLMLAVAAIVYGGETSQRLVSRIGYTGFAIETLTIYVRTIGTLLGSSAFFLLSGMVLVGLAIAAYRAERPSTGTKGE